MINNKKILAIVPARAGSKGLPDKNIKVLYGKPLIAWSIIEGKKSKYIDKLIVSTDGEKIAEVAREYDAEVPFLRPKELATDTASSINVIIHTIDFFEQKGEKFDYIVLLEPTSPLRTVKDIDSAIKKLTEHKIAKSIVPLSKAEAAHPDFIMVKGEEGLLKPFLGEEGITAKRRQDLHDVYFPNGTIFVSDVNTLKKEKALFHKLTIGYLTDRYNYLEIDEEMDLVIAEALMRYYKYGE